MCADVLWGVAASDMWVYWWFLVYLANKFKNLSPTDVVYLERTKKELLIYERMLNEDASIFPVQGHNNHNHKAAQGAGSASGGKKSRRK